MAPSQRTERAGPAGRPGNLAGVTCRLETTFSSARPGVLGAPCGIGVTSITAGQQRPPQTACTVLATAGPSAPGSNSAPRPRKYLSANFAALEDRFERQSDRPCRPERRSGRSWAQA
jgi:hypothetical protein